MDNQADSAATRSQSKSETTKFAYGKFGLKCDPRGAHVTMQHGGRTLIGKVTSAFRNYVTGTTHLTVRHLDGEAWPIEPTALAVDVLVCS